MRMNFHILHRITAACSLALLLLTSCYGDQGNYDYREINEVTIGGIDRENVYVAYAYQTTLEITPEITSTMGDEANYEYTWRIIPRDADTNKGASLDEFIVSRERNLVYPVQLSDGDYTGFFEVKDPSTGVTWIEDFYLQVISQGSTGWLVACREEGRTRLDLIGKDSKGENDVLYADLWKTVDFDMGEPQHLFFVGDNYASYLGFPVLVTDKGSYSINGNDFHIGEDTDLKWYFGTVSDRILIANSTIELYTTTWVANWWVISQEGQIYSTECTDRAFFSYPINYANGQTEFQAAPFVGVSYTYNDTDEDYNYNYATIFYDAQGRRFMAKYGESYYPALMQCSGRQLFDVETGRDMVFMDSHYEIDGQVVAVLKEPDSPRYFLYGMMLGYAKIEQNYYGEIGGPVSEARCFALHPSYNVLFYATANKVYRVNLADPGTATEIISLDEGEEITVLKYNKILNVWGTPGADVYMYDLVVCSNKKNPAAGEQNIGTFRLYEVPELANGSVTEKTRIEGLGEIVDVVYKEKGPEN